MVPKVTKEQQVRRIIRTILEGADGPIPMQELHEQVLNQAIADGVIGVGPHCVNDAVIDLMDQRLINTDGSNVLLRRECAA